jgi:hypothetical protein
MNEAMEVIENCEGEDDAEAVNDAASVRTNVRSYAKVSVFTFHNLAHFGIALAA